MALNDNVLDDITGNDVNVVLPNQDINPNKEKVTIVPEDGSNKDKTSDLTEGQLAELPKMDVEFKVVTDNVTKVADLKDVEADIMGLESICKQDAMDISTRVPGFFHKNMSIEHFTTQRSKVMFNDSLISLRRTISKEELSTIDSFNSYLRAELNAVTNVVAEIDDNYIQETIDKLYGFTSVGQKLKEALPGNKNSVFPIDDQFINIVQTPLELIDFTKVSLKSESDGVVVNNAVKQITTLLENKATKAFIFGCIAGQNVEQSTSADGLLAFASRSLTIMDITAFFCNDSNVVEFIKILHSKLDGLAIDTNKLNEEWNSISSDAPDSGKLYNFILDKTGEINTRNTEFYKFGSLINAIRLFTFQSGFILRFYESL